MTTINTEDPSGIIDREPAPGEQEDEVRNGLALASIALSGLGFLTLLSLADRRDRSPAKALGLFVATSLETLTGTVLGFLAVTRARDAKQSGKGLLLGAAGAALGIMTTLMNFNWMRTRRRI